MTRTIVHISDLHFGAVHLDTVEPLVAAIRAVEPDLVAVSGDLTQRAKLSQFQEARLFLDCLPGQLIVVPGNHDVPAIGNPWQRFFSSWGRFRSQIHPETEQTYSDPGLAVIGINTARALAFKGGRINRHQMEKVRAFFHAATPSQVKVLVVHHPLDIPHVWPGVSAGRARTAFDHWKDCGVDLILAGHEHRAFAGGVQHLRIGSHDAIVVQAGTATSSRVRGEANSFNVIRTTAAALVVERMSWDAGRNRFRETHVDRFPRQF